ncbi:MAG TPA: hypothetical protein VLD86_14555, partial [Ilumatobacteraceae bacterium]|nr:hypothetical protein [Ilumatobacteraceae bacterium]
DNADLSAAGNVAISALDVSDVDAIAGAVGLGFGAAGVGASVGVTVINKDTQAWIGQNAEVDAKGNSSAMTVLDGSIDNSGSFGVTDSTDDVRGVYVAALSSEDYFAVAVAGSGGLGAGVSGAVTVEVIDSNTRAYIDAGALINTDTTGVNANQDVHVVAANELKSFIIDGSIAGSGGGAIAGGVDVAIFRNDTSAWIAGSDVRARRDIAVAALADRDIESYVVSAAGGFVGLGAAVGVMSLGGNLSQSYSFDDDGGSHSDTATAGEDSAGNSTTVTASADSSANVTDITDLLGDYSSSGSDNADEVNSAADSASASYSGSADPSVNNSANASVSGAQTVGNTSVPKGTSAFVGTNAVISAGRHVDIDAHDRVEITLIAGGLGAGGVGIGAGIAILSVDEDVSAFIASGATISAGTVDGHLSIDASLSADYSVMAVTAGFGLFAGIAGAVVVINDGSDVKAYIADSTESAEVRILHAASVTISATSDISIHASTLGAAVAGIGGLGAAVTIVNVNNETTASIGDWAELGNSTQATPTVGNVSVVADGSVSTGSFEGVDTMAVGLAVAGGLAGAAGVAIASIASDVTAEVGDDVSIVTSGVVSLQAISDFSVDVDADGGAAALVGVGAMVAQGTITGATRAQVGSRSRVRSGSLSVTATGNTVADVAVVAASAGLFSGAGADAQASVQGEVEAFLDPGATADDSIVVAGAVTVAATSDDSATASAEGGAGGGISVGVLFASATNAVDTRAFVGDNARLSVGSLAVSASAGNRDTDAEVVVGTAAVLGGAGATTEATSGGTIEAYLGSHAVVGAVHEVEVTAQSLDTDAAADAEGGAAGGVAIAILESTATVETVTEARVEPGARVVAGRFALSTDVKEEAATDLFTFGIGIGAGATGDSTATVSGTSSVLIDDSVTIVTTGDVLIEAVASRSVDADANSISGGGISYGGIKITADLDSSNAASLGNGVSITAGGAFTLRADSEVETSGEADGGSGGLIDIAAADGSSTLTDATAVEIGDTTTVIASGAMLVEALQTIAVDLTASVDSGGLGSNASAQVSATVTTSATALIGASTLEGSTVTVRADVVGMDVSVEADAEADALGADSDGSASLTTNADATVTVRSGATLAAQDGITIGAYFDLIDTDAHASATTNGLGGDTDATSSNALDVNAHIVAGSGSTIRARSVLVEVDVDATPVFSARTTQSGAVIDTGDETQNPSLDLTRTIEFNASIIMLGPRSPEVEIGPDGRVVKKINATLNGDTLEEGAPVPGPQVVVDDIRNDDPTAYGTILLYIAASSYDGSSLDYVTAVASITGSPSVTFLTGFEFVEVTNKSATHLEVNDIDVLAAATLTPAQLRSNVVARIGIRTLTTFVPTISVDPGHTRITIENQNTGAFDVTVNGVIDNPYGATTITNAGGDILANTGAQIISKGETLSGSKGVTLSAPSGQIGTGASRIQTDSNRLNAAGGDSIFVTEFRSDLDLGVVRSASGSVDLVASGSIRDGNNDAATNVSATMGSVNLTSQNGAIGTATDFVEIETLDASPSLFASAQSGIFITENAGSLNVNRVESASGDIRLKVPDTTVGVEDLVLGVAAVISAPQGAIDLLAGDDVIAAAGSVIVAGRSVTIRGDDNEQDNLNGATIALAGTITADTVLITGGPDDDTVSLTNVQPGAETTVSTLGGLDIIRVGSNATTTTNTGGVLNRVNALLIVDAGGDVGQSDQVLLDDSGDFLQNTGTLSDTELTGLGTSGIQYTGVEDLQLWLGFAEDTFAIASTAATTTTLEVSAGAGADTLRVGSTNDATTTVINAGAGDDTINVGHETLATVNQISGLLEIRGDGDSDTLSVFDTGDTAANTGVLTVDRLTGLGMGNSDQSVVNGSRGVLYGGLEFLKISLGSQAAGGDTLTISGVATNTETTIDAGPGNDNINVGPDLDSVNAPLLVKGGTGSGDSLSLTSTAFSDLILDKVAGSATRGVITGSAGLDPQGMIEFEQVESLTVTQSDSDDFFTIVNTTTAVILNTGAGQDHVKVQTVSHPTTINLGAGQDGEINVSDNQNFRRGVTVFNAAAALTVNGDSSDSSALERLVLDRSAATAAVSAGSIKDGTTANSGVITGVTAGAVSFSGLAQVDLLLGTGNDRFEIDTGRNRNLQNTTVSVDGGGGDDEIRVLSIGRPQTIVTGGAEEDTVIVVIDTFPLREQFTTLDLTAETLVVDNSGNSGAGARPVAWTHKSSGDLEADTIPGTVDSVPATPPYKVINTQGADLTRIIGGTRADTLSIVSELNSNIDGTVDGNHVELRSGLVVFEATGFNSFTNFESVISFDGLRTGVSPYDEDGFRVSGTLTRDDSVSPALGGTGTLTLSTVSGTPFALYSLTLSATTSTSQTVAFTGTTLGGQTVTFPSPAFTVNRNSGLQTIVLPDTFNALESVTWTGTNILVDNIVALPTSFSTTAVPVVPAAPVFTTSASIVFDTADGWIESGTITVDLDCDGDSDLDRITFSSSGASVDLDRNGSIDQTLTLVQSVVGSETRVQAGDLVALRSVRSNGITQFRFAGDLVFPDSAAVSAVRASTGTLNALSLAVANDVRIGANVTFDFDAMGIQGGAGGGSGGGTVNGGPGGTGGSDGGNGRNGNAGRSAQAATSTSTGAGGSAHVGDDGASGGSGSAGIGVAGGGGGGGGGGAGDYYTPDQSGSGGGGGNGGSGGAGSVGPRGGTASPGINSNTG